MSEKTRTCAHPPCNCPVKAGDTYCSAQCAAMAKTPDLACECHHPDCKGNIGT